MKTTHEYLTEAKTKLRKESDYELAKEIGVTKQAASNWKNKKNGIDDYTAAKIAKILQINPFKVIAIANYEREKNSKKKEFWEQVVLEESTEIKQ